MSGSSSRSSQPASRRSHRLPQSSRVEGKDDEQHGCGQVSAEPHKPHAAAAGSFDRGSAREKVGAKRSSAPSFESVRTDGRKCDPTANMLASSALIVHTHHVNGRAPSGQHRHLSADSLNPRQTATPAALPAPSLTSPAVRYSMFPSSL